MHMTRKELDALRAEKAKEMGRRDTSGKDVQVVVGMGTSGIAAGAKQILDAFLDQVDEQGLANVSVTQTGPMGCEGKEPTVEVVVPGSEPVVYGNVDVATVGRIVKDHILGGAVVADHVVKQ